MEGGTGEQFGIDAEVVTGNDLVKADPEDGAAITTTQNSARLWRNACREPGLCQTVMEIG